MAEANGSSLQKSRRLSSPDPQGNVWLYPNECQLCGKNRIQHKNVRYIPYKITSFAAVLAIKEAAKSKDLTHYAEIENVDLIAKEYKVHETCYKKFTKGFTATSSNDCENDPTDITKLNATDEPSTERLSYDHSNFDQVKEFVKDMILNDQRAISMKSLHNIYGIGIGRSLTFVHLILKDKFYTKTIKIKITKDQYILQHNQV